MDIKKKKYFIHHNLEWDSHASEGLLKYGLFPHVSKASKQSS